MKTIVTLMAAAVGITAILTMPAKGAPIPAFARKYKTSCSTCHVIVPKLNDFGEAFRLNGFKIPPDDELFVKDEPLSLGASALRDEWPSAMLPSTIPGLPPISVWIRWGFVQDEGTNTKVNFTSPSLTWMIGANIGDDVSFFMEQGPKQRAYFKIDDFMNNPLFGEDLLPDRMFDLRFGLLEPDLIAFSDARRITLTEHLMYNSTYRFGTGNGNSFKFDRQIALEISGIIEERIRYVFGITNGSNESGDNNSRKDLYFRAAWKVFGGMAFSGQEDIEEMPEAKANWTDDSVTVGFFAYNGRNTVSDATAPGTTYGIPFNRFGADLRVNWGDLDLMTAVSWGEDENPGNNGLDVGIFSGLVEADYMLAPWLMLYGKFEWIQYRLPNDDLLDSQEARRTVLGITASIYPNFRVTAEYAINADLHGFDRPDTLLFRIDMDF